jgi:hypothetical protein
MPDTIITRARLTNVGDSSHIAGGAPVRDEFMVTADQDTIIGNGTTFDPLRAGGSSGGGGTTFANLTAAQNVAAGAPVYTSGAGRVSNADASASPSCNAIGLSFAALGDGETGRIITGGPIALSLAQWDALTGDSGGLVPGDWYYVSADTPGGLTSTPPDPNTDAGDFVAAVGQALSETTLDVKIQKAIGL